MEDKKRPRRKAGRTLLISSEHTEELTNTGILTDKTHKTDGGSRFVVFDTTENARSAFRNLRSEGVRVKYSYYKVFFRLSDVDLENIEYDALKESVKEMISTLGDGTTNVLYFKFYTKNSTLMGSGDLTVDTKEGLDVLVNDNEYTFSKGKVSFFRYRVRKQDDSNDQEQDAI
jgi:hypothetical protein